MNENNEINPEQIQITTNGNILMETPCEKIEECPKNKKRNIIIILIISIILLGIIIPIVIILSKKKKCDKDDCKCNNNCKELPLDINCTNCEPEPNFPNIEDDNIVININYKKNDIYIYNEILSKELNIELNESINENDDNKIFSKKSIITSKYLINIYDNKIENSTIIYYAYAVIIDMKRQIEDKELENMGGNDIREINEVNNSTPVVNFTFNKNGELLNFSINENMNITLASYLYEFIEKVIPEVSNSSFNDTRRLNENKRRFEGDRNNGKIFHDKLYLENDENREEEYWETKIEKNKVKEVNVKKIFSLFMDKKKEHLNYNYTNIKSIINQFSNNISSVIFLYEHSNNEEINNKIFNLLNILNFTNYNYDVRKLQVENLTNFRNLYYEIDAYGLPIFFNYPLFEVNILGVKIGLLASVIFNGKFYNEMFLEINEESIILFSEQKQTNFYKILDNIYYIKEVIYLILIDEFSSNRQIFDEYEIKIKEQLNRLYIDIPFQPQIDSNYFIKELNKILYLIKDSISNNFNYVYENTSNAIDKYNDLLSTIQSNNEQYIQLIKTTLNSSIENFTSINKGNIDNLYDSWIKFYENISLELEKRNEELNSNQTFTFDIGLYYNIKDEIESILNIFQNFIINLNNTLNIEHNKFKFEIDNNFNELVSSSLRKSELIAEKTKNNISIIDSLRIFFGKDEGDKRRIKIINEINTLRQSIKNIINEMNSQISIIYLDKINSYDFENIKNDINIKYELINEQKEKIFNKLKLFNKYDIDFNIYFEDIILLNEIEIEGNEARKNNYKNNIVDYLNEQSDYFLNENEINEINITINDYFNILKKYIDETRFNKAIEESEKFINIINGINNKYLTEEFRKSVINYCIYKDFLNLMFNNYYNGLNEVYLKFNSSFFNINYKNHRL